MTQYPKIYLTLDNCFAIKRWVRPRDWMNVIREIGGIDCVQASTDNEIDPLFNTQSFRDRWLEEVRWGEREYGMKLVSFYSGYATYRTVGLASDAKSSRTKIRDNYFKKVVDLASLLGAQMGNTLSAFTEPVLQNPNKFRQVESRIEKNLFDMAAYAASKNVQYGYEQMYTPTQGYFTISGCTNLLRRVYAAGGHPLYITIDTAHQAGQKLFMRPSREQIVQMIQDRDTHGARLGHHLTELVERGCSMERLEREMTRYDHIFAEPGDDDLYCWAEKLGAYSPIIHLQQTDGSYSAHRPFIKKYNDGGIVWPDRLLTSLAACYDSPELMGMPPRVKEIYLAFELFFGVTESAGDILDAVSESIKLWRKYIPRDGLSLNELI